MWLSLYTGDEAWHHLRTERSWWRHIHGVRTTGKVVMPTTGPYAVDATGATDVTHAFQRVVDELSPMAPASSCNHSPRSTGANKPPRFDERAASSSTGAARRSKRPLTEPNAFTITDGWIKSQAPQAARISSPLQVDVGETGLRAVNPVRDVYSWYVTGRRHARPATRDPT